MKTLIVTLSCLFLCFSAAVAEAPPMQVPLAPQISAAKALELADAYVAKTFPKDSSLYCQSVHLQEASVRPVRAYRHWDLVYRHAGAARSVDEKSGKETFGDFHVYVTMTGDISHELVSLIAVIPVLRDSGDGTLTGLAIAQEIPTGKLGFPVGTYLRIEGVRVEGIKTGERTLRVDTVNGKKLDKSIEVAVENVESLPKGGRCILRGYETGQMIGTPPALEQAAKEEGRDIPLPQAGWEFRRHFVVISVVEPKNLVLTNTGSGENTTPATAQAIVAGLVAELGALAANHAELAGFPEYVKRLESDQAVEFKTNVMPLALTFQKSVSPVLTKRHIRPSDCGTNGIFFLFVLDDGTNPRQAPADIVTHLPNLKLILYADLVLWEKASPELRKELAGIMARHQGMLIELDKKAANKPDELEILPAAPQGDVERPSMRSGKLLPALPAGRLGYPLGAYLRIEGVRVEGIKTAERTLLVDTVNGKKLDKSIEVAVENLESLPKGGRCILRGYETGQMIGTPPALEQAAKEEGKDIPLPQTGWEFRRYFMVISVVEPKDLARLGNDKEPHNQSPDDGRITAEQARQIGVEWMQKEYGNDAEQRTHAPYDVRDSGDHWLIIGSSVDGTLDGLSVTVNKKTREVELRTDRGAPDAICDMLFQNYIVRGGKINTSTIMAASHIIAERGRETGFWKIVLEKLRGNDEGNEIGCVRILGKMLAIDARARDIIRTGEVTAWDASVRLPPEVVEEMIARGKKADRFRVDHYCIALARARVPEAQDFFHLILRDDTGKSYMPTARFFSAVGLAHLGNPAGFEWLIANCEDSLPTISNAWPASVPNLNVDTSCVAALKSLTGAPNLNTKAEWETWWKSVDRKTLPKGPVNIVDP